MIDCFGEIVGEGEKIRRKKAGRLQGGIGLKPEAVLAFAMFKVVRHDDDLGIDYGIYLVAHVHRTIVGELTRPIERVGSGPAVVFTWLDFV